MDINGENNRPLSPEEKNDIATAVDILKKGGIILYPTDTVWGLGCDATNPQAIEKIYKIKQRNHAKALITLVSDMRMLERTVEEIPEIAYDLIDVSVKPVTVVYDRGLGVASNLMPDDGTLAVRVTNEPFSRALCRTLGRPLVSTSANVSGKQTPSMFSEISSEIMDSVDYVCKSRRAENRPSQSSTIIRLKQNGEFKILRP